MINSRRKGDRAERALVKLLQLAGFAAERCPMSGSGRGRFSGYDVNLPLLARDHRVEVKHHATGFRRLYAWLAPVDLLVIKGDNVEPLVVVPLRFAIEIAQAAEQWRSCASYDPKKEEHRA